MNGARAKVKPIPERPIAYAVASLFLKYNAVTTEKAWYNNAKPNPKTKDQRRLVIIVGVMILVGTSTEP